MALKSVLEPQPKLNITYSKPRRPFETICKVIASKGKVYPTNPALDFNGWDLLVQHSLLFSEFTRDKMKCTVNLDALPQPSFEWFPSKHSRVKYYNFQDDWKKDEAIRCKNTFRSSKNLLAKLGLICPI